MQRKTPVKLAERTMQARIHELNGKVRRLKDMHTTMKHFGFQEQEDRIAHFILLAHTKRIQRAIDDLPKKWPATTLSDEEQVELTETQTLLQKLVGKITKKIPAAPELKLAMPTVIVAGAGSVGDFAVKKFLERQEYHQANVVLIVDNYADVPMRGGKVDQAALTDYMDKLGVAPQKVARISLLRLLRLKDTAIIAIKHLDILGQAVVQATGGIIMRGKLDWGKIKKIPGAKFPTVAITSEEKEAKATEIAHVCCVLNTMGDKASYPPGIKKEELLAKKLLRTHGLQANITLPQQLSDKMDDLRGILEEQKNGSYMYFAGKSDSEADTQKIQIYCMLTEPELRILHEIVEREFSPSIPAELDEDQRKDIKIVLKAFLYIDYLAAQAGIDIKFEELQDIILRDQIKLGKKLCAEFENRQPAAPPRTIVSLAGTEAVTTWGGGAALPTIINGELVTYSLTHIAAVIDDLIKTNFKPHDFAAGSDTDIAFNAWLDFIKLFIESEHTHSPDVSAELTKYFAKKFKAGELKPSQNSTPGILTKLKHKTKLEQTTSSLGESPGATPNFSWTPAKTEQNKLPVAPAMKAGRKPK